MSKIINVANKTMILCFVCDQKVTGEKVNLASSISMHSKVTLPEKISQLIGDDYVVAVTEQDCVCKRCASLLNHMDKLENELTLVKRALTTNIAQKYKISFDGQVPPVPATPISAPAAAAGPQQVLANGLKSDSTSDYEDEGRKSIAEPAASNTSLLKKRPTPPSKIVTTPKPAKPAENVTKLKIYKCGFCSYQSKELSNVRLHMKIHIRANKPEGDGDKGPAASTPLLPSKTPVSVRRRVFRCQVCSASFDDRNKCLEHISRDHTAAGRKTMEQKQTQDEKSEPQLSKKADEASESAEPSGTKHTDQEEAETQETLKETDEAGSQEEMDTSEPPSIALYSCDNGPDSFNTDVDFASHANENANDESANPERKASVEGESRTTDVGFTQVDSQDETQPVDDETPKEASIGLDIEAMIAALHSEGPETATDSMPNI